MNDCCALPSLLHILDFNLEACYIFHHSSDMFHQKLREKLDAAAAKATPHAWAGEFDEAERGFLRTESSSGPVWFIIAGLLSLAMLALLQRLMDYCMGACVLKLGLIARQRPCKAITARSN